MVCGTVTVGNINDALTLDEAITDSRIKPGHTIWLRGGVYAGDRVFAWVGEAANPITIRPYPGEVVIIDGDVDIRGAYNMWLCDHRIIFRNSAWIKRELLVGELLVDIGGKPFDINSNHIVLRHPIIHDYNNVGFWSLAVAGELYAPVIFNIGWTAPDRGHGHLVYTQNNTPAKLIKHVMGGNNFGWGLHAYTESGTINNFNVIENTFFNTGILDPSAHHEVLIGGGATIADTVYAEGNSLYGTGWRWYGDGAINVSFIDNYIPHGITSNELATYIVYADNVITQPESGSEIRLYADDYDTNKAYLTIYNWDLLDTITVDTLGIFSGGDTIQVWNVQGGVSAAGAWQDVQTLTVAGDGSISVDMQAVNRIVSVPYQWSAPATTFPTFGAFVIQRQ